MASRHPVSCMCPECLPRNRLPPAPRRNGCHNRPPLGADNRVLARVDGILQGTRIPHRMTVACQYTATDAGRVDPGCTGCGWRQA